MKKIVLLAFVLVLLSTAVVVRFVRPVVADGTIYIKADGSIDPPTANITSVDNITYTFTDNIYDHIVVERDNIVVDGAGCTLLGPGFSGTGIYLWCTSNVTIKNVKIKTFSKGIYLGGSSYNSIYGNNITNNEYGVWLEHSSKNNIYGNNITDNGHGLHNGYGIWLIHSSNNNIYGNNITNNEYCGIRLFFSSNNSVYGNNVTNNWIGILLDNTSDNFIYHNNFIDNTNEVYIPTSGYANFWDDDYPSGGNYWSDYTGVDSNHDGIGDTPYVINENNQDNYPLMSPWGLEEVSEEEIPFWTQWWFWAIVAAGIEVLAGAVYFLKKRKPPTPTAPPLPSEGTLQNIHPAYSCHSHLQTKTTQMRARFLS